MICHTGFIMLKMLKKTIKKLERCIKGLCNSKEEVQWVLNLIIKLFGKELTEEKAQWVLKDVGNQ